MSPKFKKYFVNKLKKSNFFGRSSSIRNRMVLAFVLLVLLPAIAIIISSTIIGIRSERQLAIEQLESVVILKKEEIKDWIELLKNNLVLRLFDEKTNASLSVLLSKGKQEQGAREDAHQYIHDRFHGYQSVSNDFDELSLILPNGNIVLTTAQEIDPDVSVLQTYFKEKLSEPKILFQINMLAVFMPVKDQSGETAGIIYGRVKLDKLIEIMLERSRLGESGETYLVGLDHTLLTPSRFAKYQIGKTHVYTEGAMDALERHVYAHGLYKDYRGIPIIGVYLWLPELKAVLLAERDQKEVFSLTYSGIIINLVVAFLAVLLAIIASFMYSKTITEPISNLANTATRIAEGNLKLTAKAERQDEIGMLANAFNSMTEQLTDLIGKLEARLLEIKRNEEALRASETRYRIVAEHTYDWEFWQNPDGQFLYMSPSCEEITGYKPADFEADPNLLFRIIHPEDLPVYEAHLREMSGKQFVAGTELEFRIVSSDGTPRWIAHVCKLVFDEAGEFLGMRGSHRDITGRKKAEELRARLSAIVESSDDAIISKSLNGIIQSWNAGAEKMYGYSGKEVIGKHISLLAPHGRPDDVSGVLEKITRGQNIDHYETERMRKNGKIFNISLSVSAIKDANGNTVGASTIARDITDRKLAEEEIRKLNQELEQRVRDRTAKLEAANKEMHAFTYSVSHDLRAPLRHIDGFVGLLQKRAGTALDEKSRHYMDAISDSAKKMGLLIDDLLSFSRMGRHAMSFQQVELGNLVHEVMRELEPDAAGRDIDWRVVDLPVVTGDHAMLRMVLVNLISNALKFTQPRQQAQIEIGCRPDAKTETAIFVRDNGVGFDMTYADKLFGVFQRLHRSDEFEGTGIGLANVRRIIVRHGGRTWAEGKVDQGATFYFSLP